MNLMDDSFELEYAVEAVKDARIVIMNPPFTNRTKMGEKYSVPMQQALRQRTDYLGHRLVCSDVELQGLVNKNSIGSTFIALGDKCLSELSGVLTIIEPTIALSSPSNQSKRLLLASRYHIHTVLTCHQPSQINLSQNTSINESIVIAVRHSGDKSPTRFINLDRFPVDDAEADDLHQCLSNCSSGSIEHGWGNVCEWPAEMIEAGDWTPAIWRSHELAKVASKLASDPILRSMKAIGLFPQETGRLLRGSFERATTDFPNSFPILSSKGASGQITIQSMHDEHWIPKQRDESIRQANGGRYPEVDQILSKAGYLLITAGQDNRTARLTATASDTPYIGNGWMPVHGMTAEEAKALAVFINSTPGRLQLMRNMGKKLEFPVYSTSEAGNIRVPDIKDSAICHILADCWQQTRHIIVPQFRDGECEVRRLWDDAVADAMGWDKVELARLRMLLHQEPHVRGLGYNQYEDEADDEPSTDLTLNERFLRLVAEWRSEIAGLSSPQALAKHPAYQEIIAMGEPALPLILRDLRDNGGWWYPALRTLTGENPVSECAKGNVSLNDEAWLRWGRENGYIE